MDDLKSYFVESDDLQFKPLSGNQLLLQGRILCTNGLFVDVYKILESNDLNQVRTYKYSYQAGLVGETERTIFRYDNAHEHTTAGHKDRHHKHNYDHITWREIEPPEWLGHARWPTLKDVLEELYQWWLEVGKKLDLSESH